MTMRAFISYARRDETWAEELLDCLSPLVRERLLETQRDYTTNRGTWLSHGAIENADMSFVLLSPSYLGSHSCMVELNHALRNRSSHPVIPILLRRCDSERHLPHDMQPLPTTGPMCRQVDPHEAWEEIYRHVRVFVAKFMSC